MNTDGIGGAYAGGTVAILSEVATGAPLLLELRVVLPDSAIDTPPLG
eukprot:CAMPEP_0194759690 /NCGR_PEP_ID=MMETSP0323_2-20130528/12717_1 /TAXON_ID=2866 ORGANISM="Crypthecodinium cohnii, Strain Seligo" /NCGR_SAMPLE_ID=MMETSP0323_2 /ASSEMBLY_ACC=CAM_ASM_000346 /LENGTH=46 /DNA_ID= /DNA_START= /DNA_END= /DNA_ORIENTATION=